MCVCVVAGAVFIRVCDVAWRSIYTWGKERGEMVMMWGLMSSDVGRGYVSKHGA